MGGPPTGAKLIHVETDAKEIGRLRDAHVPIVADSREVLKALNAHKGSVLELRVGDVMIPNPTCGSPEDSLESLREMMNKDHIRYLPVRDGDQLLGVISFHDVANAVIKEVTLHNRMMKSYIKNWPEQEPAK